MKGIILAGGSGTRLAPLTKFVNKQLLPVYDKPMLYYPLSSLILAGIRDILIISTPTVTPQIEVVLRNGKQFGVNIEYQVQEAPKGLPEAFILGEKFLGHSPSCLVLGDNIFYGHGFIEKMQRASEIAKEKAVIFGYHVKNPSEYGVVVLNEDQKIIELVEKPKELISNLAIPGMYFYPPGVSNLAKNLKPSARGELEITDLNRSYLSRNQLQLEMLGRGTAWLDTGSPENLLLASNFIHTIESRQGLKVGSPEEAAYRRGFISKEELRSIAKQQSKSEYGQYLLSLI